MSSYFDPESFKERLANMCDDEFDGELLGFGLEPEAWRLVVQEAKRRGAEDRYELPLKVRRGPSDAEVVDLIHQARSRPCPKCGSQSAPLNAFKIQGVRFLKTHHDSLLACPTCLRRAAILGILTLPLSLSIWRLGDIVRNLQTLLRATEPEQTSLLEDQIHSLWFERTWHQGSVS